MLIHVSSAEQKVYDFKSIVRPVLNFETRREYMKTADYGVCRPRQSNLLDSGDTPWSDIIKERTDDCCVIERKSMGDFFGSIGGGRDRLDDEMQRMSKYGFGAIIVEADWSMLLTPNASLTHPTRVNIASMVGSIISWTIRYGVHFWPMANRHASEQVTYRVLERWMREARP